MPIPPAALKRMAAMCLMLMGMLMLMAGAIPHPAHADTGGWQGDGHFRARLISAAEGTGDAAVLEAGIEFEMQPGWKVYWRDPGDAGIPTEIEFLSGVRGHTLAFPAPQRFSILGLDSYGYSGRAILPLTLTLDAPPSAPLRARARLTGLICKDICIPLEETLRLDVAAGEAVPSQHARGIAEARALVPSPGTAAGATLTGAAVAGDMLVLDFMRGGRALNYFPGDIFIEGAGSGYGFAAPRWQGGRAHIAVTGNDAASLIGKDVAITAVANDFLLEANTRIAATPLPRDGRVRTLIAILAVAFLGGVILNAMPCVLPVLSLKLSSVLGQGGAARKSVRLSFIATASGVVASFLLLGLGLLAAREAGAGIGWGVQFQQPVFLAIAALAIAGFGLVLLDVIHIPVPQFASRLASRIPMPHAGGAAKNGGGKSLAHDFSSGALATLLATPCSAPFVGTAVAFALTATPPVMLAVFLVMGLGLASPWLVVAARPQMLSLLPKPGRWLIWMKRILALGLFATALWLVSVLAGNFTGSGGGIDRGWTRWQPELAGTIVRDEGRVVLVDVTADWCITCKTNKRLVIDTDAMRATLAEGNVAMLQADWTRPDDTITAYLASFGRYGIPFNIVYGPAAPDGIILPEILTANALRDALRRAAG